MVMESLHSNKMLTQTEVLSGVCHSNRNETTTRIADTILIKRPPHPETRHAMKGETFSIFHKEAGSRT